MKRSLSFTGRTVLAVILVLLLADSALSYVLLRNNRAVLKSMIDARLLDVANTAAATVDGDVLKSLTAEDAHSPLYRRIYNQLRVFQDNIDLEYIYAVNIEPDGSFTFNVDPSDQPGEFGSPIATTDGLILAASGTPGVDGVPYTDAWGRFYSAYSPVFDSTGQVAGIIGVDYSADRYEQLLSRGTGAILIVSVLTLILGVAVAVLATRGLRKRFDALSGEMSGLAADMEALTKEINRSAQEGFGRGAVEAANAWVSAGDETPEPPEAPVRGDAIEELGAKTRAMQRQLRDYLKYAQKQAYTDGLTGVGSRTAYLEMLPRAMRHLDDGTAHFSVTIFDIDNLKHINDTLGHEIGDRVIAACAAAIVAGFGDGHLYRIGGDEFVAVRAYFEETDESMNLQKWSDALTAELASVTAETPELPVSVSWGSAIYDPATDEGYHAVFRRAEEAMYQMKAHHHGRRE